MFIKHPGGNLRPDYYLQPFLTDVKLAVLCLIIIGSIIILISQKIIPENRRNFVDNSFLTFENFCNQSGNDYMQNISLRIACLATRMNAFIIVSCFGAVVISYIAVEIPNVPFTNLEEFLQNGKFKLVLRKEKDHIMHLYFRVKSLIVLMRKFFEQLIFRTEWRKLDFENYLQ